MNENLIGTKAFGMRIPFVKEGEGLIDMIVNNYVEVGPMDGDIIGVTESVVARTAGMYVKYEDVGKWIHNYKPSASELVLYCPIFSRNRFVPILRGMLTASNIEKVTIVSGDIDEVGNFVEHPITKVNYRDLYRKWVEDAGKEFDWVHDKFINLGIYTEGRKNSVVVVNCKLHDKINLFELSLGDICKEKSSWGLLGMNAAGNDRIKLFPDEAYSEYFVNTLQETIKSRLGKNVDVMIYGDGAYKDPVSGIWEWADPVVSPAWTSGLDGMPTEIKLKNAIDSGMSDGDIKKHIKDNRGAAGQELGTTPRRVVDLLGSLMDLVSGSGDKGTPVVIVRDYFKKYID